MRPSAARSRTPQPALPAGEEAFLDRTIEVFQPYSPTALTREDARECAVNVIGLFGLLLQLKKARLTREQAAAEAEPARESA